MNNRQAVASDSVTSWLLAGEYVTILTETKSSESIVETLYLGMGCIMVLAVPWHGLYYGMGSIMEIMF